MIYILIELLEHKTSFTKDHERLQGSLAPLIGAATGIIPQCGFSVMAAKLYDRGLIRTGTLLSVFLATSDEALIILLSEGSRADMIVPLIAINLSWRWRRGTAQTCCSRANGSLCRSRARMCTAFPAGANTRAAT